MSKKHEIFLTADQAGEVLAPIIGVVLSMNPENVQYWIGKKKKLANEMRKILVGVNPYADIISDWEVFWNKIDGKGHNFSNVVIPEKPEGNWRLLTIADATLEAFYAKSEERFPCRRWTNDDFDKIVTWNERSAENGPYAIWVRDEIEADENLKNKSANAIKEMKITTETLAERLVHELKFFSETDKHLDVKNITLCAGSRSSGGRVPGVCWDSDKMRVGWYIPDDAGDDLRSRAAVSL